MSRSDFFFPIDFLNLKTYSNFIQTLKIPCFSYQSITGSFSRFRHPRFSIFRPRRKLVISTGSPMFRLPRKDEVPLTGMVQSTVGGDNGDDDDHHIDGRKEDILNSLRCWFASRARNREALPGKTVVVFWDPTLPIAIPTDWPKMFLKRIITNLDKGRFWVHIRPNF